MVPSHFLKAEEQPAFAEHESYRNQTPTWHAWHGLASTKERREE
jgi:hypothetical protein